MKILITGTNSYTGNALRDYLSRWPEHYETETMSLRTDAWRSESFTGFDSVFHVAGIAHDSTKSADKEQYFRVNSELAYDAAMKAKNDGVTQFVFMSSSIVYGNHSGIITRDTEPSPSSYYGESKVRAEGMLAGLEDDGFKVAILRCPMIYGKGCRGNYRLLSRIARTVPAFPYVRNFRSMLYVRNMCEFVRLVIDDRARGIFWPQNGVYSNTSDLVRMIAEVHGRRMRLVRGMEGVIRLMGRFSGKVRKAFGSLAYDMSLSVYPRDYRVAGLRESIEETELSL